jgi:hypothetical protein
MISSDTVSLGTATATQFPFLTTYSQPNNTYFSYFSGILGLAPKDDSAGPLLIDYLYD